MIDTDFRIIWKREAALINYNQFTVHMLAGQERTVGLTASVSSGTTVADLRLEPDVLDPLPAGLEIVSGPPVRLDASQPTASTGLTIRAGQNAPQSTTLVYNLVSGQGADRRIWHAITVRVQCSEAKAALFFSPTQIVAAQNPGTRAGERLVITNKGLAAASGLAIRKTSGPDWVGLRTAQSLGALEAGESREVLFVVEPGASVAPGQYDARFEISATGLGTWQYQVLVTVSSTDKGDATFKVLDIFTGTVVDGAVQLGVSGAVINLVQEETGHTAQTSTDSAGSARLSGLPVGPYQYKVRKAGHQEGTGRVWVRPGVTGHADVFLDYNLVTVEWDVREITLEDRYEVVLRPVFTTHVSDVARVVPSPMSLTLPRMQAGEEFCGEISLANTGGMAAMNVSLSAPADNAYLRYELLASAPEIIEAGQTVVIPYRITALRATTAETPASTGGAKRRSGSGECGTLAASVQARYSFPCANGHHSQQSTGWAWYAPYGHCSGGTPAPGTPHPGGVSIGGGNVGSGGTAISSPAPAAKPVQGVKCLPEPERPEFCPPCFAKDVLRWFQSPGDQWVNLLSRGLDFHLPLVDGSGLDGVGIGPNFVGRNTAASIPARLSGQARTNNTMIPVVPGDQRVLAFTHENDNLTNTSGEGGVILRGGVVYRRLSAMSDVFTHRNYTLRRETDGFRWSDPQGNFRQYSLGGALVAKGDRLGVQYSYRYEAGRLVAQLDRQGRTVLTFGYAGDNLVRITDLAGREVSVTYAGDQIATVTDAQGRTTRFGYTGNRLTSVTEASGLVTTFTYDVYGYLRTLSDNAGRSRVYDYNYDIAKRQFYAMTRTSGGRTEEYWYSSDLELVRRDVDGRTVLAVSQDGRSHTLTDASGLKTIKEYDEWDNLIRTVHPDGSEEKRTYDRVFNQVLTKTDALGVVTAYSYDELGNVLTLTEALGTHLERNSAFAYDEAGHVVNATRGPGTTTMEYDQWGNLVRLADAAGGVTAFTHDVLGNVLTRRDGAGQVWTSKYNNAGQLVQAVDPSGNATTYEYDPSGNRVRTVDPAGHTTILGYDLAGRMVNATDALGGVTRFQYDPEDRLTGREDAAGLAQSYGYTLTGELAETVDAAGTTRMVYAAQGAGCASCSGGSGDKPVRIEYPTFTRTLAYDQRGRKVRETDTSTTETRGQDFVYDKAGRLVETRQWAHDPDLVQSTTKYEYDQLGRMTSMTDASGGQTRYVYDVWDNLKTLTDPKDQSTQFAHDTLGRVTVETRPLGGQTTYAYTAAGQLQKRTDARGVRTEYAYDALGRVSTVSSYAPGQTEPGRVVSLGYDRLGRLISYTDGQTSGLLAYDALGRKTAETVNYGPFSRTNTYTWAANGQLSGFTGPDGQAQTFAYDTAGRLTAIGLGSHMATVDAYTWTAPGSITLPGGVKRSYGHDGFLRLIAQNATDPVDNPILDHAYQYNDRGNMARKATEHGDYAYAYDILDRLITSQNPGLSDESFTYDKVGNRLSAGDTIGSWSYNANNELQGFDGVQYRYDDHGNLIEKTQPGKTLTFAYDLDNRLSEVKENAAAQATYGYDPFGRRIWKEVHGSRTYYHYSDQGLVAELDATGTLLKVSAQ